ncbi:deoxyguanosinetriphosphate triphosphohydrolase [Halopseudomonas aestusnigri]|jgi:dGTPase|uniref:deoxyguanosinetriphosphate triphosphohydrolase n=1 Tax=Halopseudomonas aestusnigri TaxID=857252 RepID=UPI000C476AD2|nr:deoxyguanosinetriphosphate triphosphohydrolase [Pseudomonadales bacterium]MCK5530672.1 deoxyguanosinetriphosphate triphosphohydrolase [Halopseudomonas aestusnigri]HBT58789.1 deoxyguanosinetriphosphate triphosphohydrolase [Pseudomonas sp.]MAK74532.1 deoxyguanosinetriphosphate triphosphohydrolase [Pseudomonadales bacterium]MAP76390.1 deoxyguanosinetriphosphate triphosphohydrolase [Pseudomonadales bacterium]|tara:strand:+ start:2976 stop:4304 length:1329 start_codon:yes stop_codon:yes gene_type:complete
MDWETLLCRERLGKTFTSDEELGRTPFHKDHDRVIFSGAFRRLGKKTQVHPVSSNDHIHTRLTHSLEVGCVGRSLGMRVGEMLRGQLPEWCQPADLGVIVQAACLAHDIGNPPYGHSGEDAIRHWFRQAAYQGLLDALSDAERNDFLHFEGNAQGFRVLTQIEYHQAEGGMRLTYATLGAYLKYPWTARHADTLGYKKNKFGCYQAEYPLLKQIAEKLGLPAQGDQRFSRHPLVYLVEAADDICYGLIDLEDGLEMDLLAYAEVEQVLLDLVGDDLPETYRLLGPQDSQRRRLAILRGKAIEHLVNAAAEAFIEQQPALLAGDLEGDLVEHMHGAARRCVLDAKQMARKRIFQDKRKTLHEIGAYSTLETLLDAFCGAVNELHAGQNLSFKHQRILDLLGHTIPQADWPPYRSYLRVVDFIAGMTDLYAADMAAQLRGISRN